MRFFAFWFVLVGIGWAAVVVVVGLAVVLVSILKPIIIDAVRIIEVLRFLGWGVEIIDAADLCNFVGS